MLSPLDDRYHQSILPLEKYFSDRSIWETQLYIEKQYLSYILPRMGVTLTEGQEESFEAITMNDEFYKRCKENETLLRHDLKALEVTLREYLIPIIGINCSYIHFGLTSEDVKNLAQTINIKNAVHSCMIPLLLNLLKKLRVFAEETKDVVMLARTHAQPAVPTIMGREVSVYMDRLMDVIEDIHWYVFKGKIGGAIGCLNASRHACPKTEWRALTAVFIRTLGLGNEEITTQVSSGYNMSHFFYLMVNVNNILIDLCRDIWMYVLLGYLNVKKVGVGSSTMPQKSNPIEFENAEGNLEFANVLFSFFADKITKSRLQRDLSGSTVMRNIGVAFGHTYLAYRNISAGLIRLNVNNEVVEKDLFSHPEVYSEAIQHERRASGDVHGYEEVAANLINCKPTKEQLLSYIGYAPEQIEYVLTKSDFFIKEREFYNFIGIK